MNTYGYVGGNPLGYIDPLGLDYFNGILPGNYGIAADFERKVERVITPIREAAGDIAEAGLEYGPYAIGGLGGIVLKQGVKQCAKKIAKNKDLCKIAALAGLVGISVCQNGKVPKGIGRMNKHIEFVTKTTKKIRNPREPIVQPK